MILILSSAKDRTTHEVCKWLLHLNKKFLVIHQEDRINIESITNDAVWLKLIDRDILFNLESCTSFWYRRDNFSILGGINIENSNSTEVEPIAIDPIAIGLKKFISTNIGSDLLTATQYLHFLLLQKNSIASIFNANVNKLNVLNLAQKQGVKIPDYILTGSKEKVGEFRNKHENIIFKTPSPSIQDTFEELSLMSLTGKLSDIEYAKLPQNFGLTFFQEQIQKKFEIRTFYLNGKFYSIALISQKNEKTKVDYRNYDKEFPNRSVPFKLPDSIELKAKKIITALKLDTCSIDWIYTPKGEIYFLEINPVGQFGNVAFHRNDQLEKEIALFLN